MWFFWYLQLINNCLYIVHCYSVIEEKISHIANKVGLDNRYLNYIFYLIDFKTYY